VDRYQAKQVYDVDEIFKGFKMSRQEMSRVLSESEILACRLVAFATSVIFEKIDAVLLERFKTKFGLTRAELIEVGSERDNLKHYHTGKLEGCIRWEASGSVQFRIGGSSVTVSDDGVETDLL